MSDDFFDKIDKQLGEQKAAADVAKSDRDSNTDFAKGVIGKARPIADDYAAKLKERGIDAKAEGHEQHISFRLRWANGDSTDLSFGVDYKSGRLEFVKHARDNKGPYAARDGSTYDEQNWKDSYYEATLKEFINEFMGAAARHGGASKA